jgi:NhaA family Na+:H+ antiporter
LGALSLLDNRVPASLKVFLAGLAIIDDLVAVLIIAVFYTSTLNLVALGGATVTMVALCALNRFRVRMLFPYLTLGAVLWVFVFASLWVFVFASGMHATLAGVMVAFTIPLNCKTEPNADAKVSSLLKLEHLFQKPVAFAFVPLFGFVNAGVSFAGISLLTLIDPITLGVAAGLFMANSAACLLSWRCWRPAALRRYLKARTDIR